MTLVSKEIKIGTLLGIVSLVGTLISVGMYIGRASQVDAQQTQDISDIKANMITKEEFGEFKKTNQEMLNLIRKAYPNY